jgi:hypothetical protein
LIAVRRDLDERRARDDIARGREHVFALRLAPLKHAHLAIERSVAGVAQREAGRHLGCGKLDRDRRDLQRRGCGVSGAERTEQGRRNNPSSSRRGTSRVCPFQK